MRALFSRIFAHIPVLRPSSLEECNARGLPAWYKVLYAPLTTEYRSGMGTAATRFVWTSARIGVSPREAAAVLKDREADAEMDLEEKEENMTKEKMLAEAETKRNGERTGFRLNA